MEFAKVKHGHFRAGLDSGEILVMRLPDKKVMRIVSRSVFIALVMLTLPCIRSILKNVSVSELDRSDVIKFEQLGLLFNDLAGEGLRGEADKSLIVSPGNVGIVRAIRSLNVVDHGFEIAMDSDSERKSSFKDESVDFVFAFDLVDAKFVDRVLKVGGVVAVPLSNDPSNAFSKKSNYKIVYLRRYTSTFVAMRKTGPAAEQKQESPDHRRRLCQFGSEAKETVLQGLEDVLLEPPRRALAKSSEYLKKLKFLPNLLGNSLENYERRVFVNVDLNEQKSGAVEWFNQNYPKMNTKFEVHNLEVEVEEEEEASRKPQNDVSGWLKETVKEEDYVVMKAEAEVVVDLMQKSTICLVDELFLECNNEWWQNGKSDKSKRAYWECVALHGRLRDLGVAVHQWFL